MTTAAMIIEYFIPLALAGTSLVHTAHISSHAGLRRDANPVLPGLVARAVVSSPFAPDKGFKSTSVNQGFFV